jgi:two-component system, LytTR family, response regulator
MVLSMKLKVVIADDEVLARQKLLQLLEFEEQVQVVGEGANALETMDLVRFTCPDLLLLDIQMPDLDGFGVISALSAKSDIVLPRVIFTTAYDQYALRAFEINAIDYLLKPFTRVRLTEALQRATQQIRTAHTTPVSARRSTSEDNFETRLVFKSRGRILFLPVADIYWIGAEENYVRICTLRDNHLLRETMAHFETRLDPRHFLRVHRSAIVNLQHVKEIRSGSQEGDSFVLMQDGQKVPLSRSYRARISHLLSSQVGS